MEWAPPAGGLAMPLLLLAAVPVTPPPPPPVLREAVAKLICVRAAAYQTKLRGLSLSGMPLRKIARWHNN